MPIEIQYEREAMNNVPMFKELSGVDLLAHLAACWLYAEHHAGKISRDDGTKMKKRIVEALQSATEKEIKDKSIWARAESASRNFMQNKTVDNAVLMHNAFYNLPN